LSDHKFHEEGVERIKNIKALIVDVDGVMTDGDIILDHDGHEIKKFNVQDGLGIFLARQAGLVFGIITGRASRVVELRANELNVDFLSMGRKNKLNPYKEFKKKFGLKDEEICFLGDDLLDLPVMLKCGFAACVANGRNEVKYISQYVTEASGGDGAVREMIEYILQKQDKWEAFLNNYYERLAKTKK